MEEDLEKIKGIAEICHQTNKAWCELHGDMTQDNWIDAPAWQQESAIKGVRHRMANPDGGPDSSHNSWLAEKEATGWVYGEVKDVEKKTHPCYVPYADLPEMQRKKDSLFIAIVDALK